MAATTQEYDLIENAILNNVQIIKNDFMLLHQRQKGMINQLENDFLQAIPEKIKNMSVADFLNKFDGDMNKAFSQLTVVDLNLSQTLSNASTLPLQSNINYVLKDKLLQSNIQSNSFMENFPKSNYHNYNNQNQLNSSNSKSILKNSKRKRNEYEQNQKKLLNHLYQTHQNNYSNNKENISQNGTSQMYFSQQSKQNTAKKHNNNNQNQNTTSKSGKKIWKF
ncbi:hypothetical protein ABPG74_013655 [Tetrahymena malaccensis]